MAGDYVLNTLDVVVCLFVCLFVCPSIFFETIHSTVPISHTFVKYVLGRKPVEFGDNRPIRVLPLSPAHLRYRMTTSLPDKQDRTNKPHPSKLKKLV